MKTDTGGLGPAGETADAVIDFLLAEMDDLNIGARFPHAFDEDVQHQAGLAFSLTAGA